MSRKTKAVEPWKRGRIATVPVTAAWVGAAGAVINEVTDIAPGSTGSIVLGGVTLAATASTALGAWAKGAEEKRRGLRGLNKWQGAYLTACTCAAGSWLTWAASTMPYGPYTAGSFAAGTLAAWLLYPWYRYSRRDAIAAAHPAATPVEDGPGTDWERILHDAGQKDVREQGSRVDTPGGYLVRLSLPEHGRVTYKTLLAAKDRIEVIAGRRLHLRAGGLAFEEQTNPAEVLMHITTRDVLAELIPLPHDMELIDSNAPFPIGVYEDGTPMMWDFLAHGMVVGMTDTGKSNLLNVLVKKSAQMVDTLTFVIDPKGGRFVRPWTQPLLDRRIQRPVIDWVATDTGPWERDEEGRPVGGAPAEYDRILTFACEEIKRRSSLQLGGTEKAATSPDLPRIVIIVDEVTDVVSVPRLREKVTTIVRKGRSEGVIIILAGQRGTVTMFGSGDLKSQIRNRAGLGVTSQTDANTVFPNSPRLGRIITRLTHQGTILVQLGPRGRVLPGKVHRIDPERDIDRLAIALSGRRPGLPQDAADYHGETYTGRWDAPRVQHLYVTNTTHLEKEPPVPSKPKPRPEHPGGSTIGSTARRLGLPPSKILNEMGIGDQRQEPAAKPDKPRVDLSPEGQRLAESAEAFLAAHAPAPETAGAVDERRAFVRKLVFDGGPRGIETTEIFAALRRKFGEGWNRSVVQTWLGLDVDAGRMHRPGKGRYAHGPGEARS